MDKYQKYILKQIEMGKIFVFSRCCPIDSESAADLNKYGAFDESADTFNITQDEDITKTQYSLIIDMEYVEANPFEGIFVHKDNQWEEVACVNKQYRILVDFNYKTDAIKFSFINKIADDYILKITYTEADKEQYYSKLEQARKDNLLATAEIKVSTGADLVNIYFQPCSDDYGKTVIELYTANGKWQPHPNVIGRGQVFKPRLLGAEVALLMGKFTVEDGMFFKSIGGLAKGAYGYRLSQYNTKGE